MTGLDFSDVAIQAARDLAGRAGLADRADFVCAPVADAIAVLGGGTFDLVYVSLGALCWLPSVDEWAGPGGRPPPPGRPAVLHEIHPVSMALADDDLTLVYPYFEDAPPYGDNQAG